MVLTAFLLGSGVLLILLTGKCMCERYRENNGGGRSMGGERV